MPRDSSGNYTLPAGNPVITGSIIASSWANNTFADIATELTDSLDRSGKGGMLAPFKIQDGALATPGLAFASEPGSGIYRIGSAHWALVVTGTNVMDFAPGQININTTVDGFTMNGPLVLAAITATGLAEFTGDAALPSATTSGAYPGTFAGSGNLELVAGSGAVDNRRWNITTNSTSLSINANTDNLSSGTAIFSATRSGSGITAVTFNGTSYTFNTGGFLLGSAAGGNQGNGTINALASYTNGVQLGYLGTPPNSQSGSYTLVLADRGKSVVFTATATLTLPQSIFAEGDMQVIVAQGGVVTISAGTGVTLTWANGGSTTGTRTLTNVGIATIWWFSSTQAYITGSGVS